MGSRQVVKCTCCDGHGHVAMVRIDPRDLLAEIFPELCNRPMAVTFARARQLLQEFDVRRSGPRRPADPRAFLVRSLASHLDTVPCPHCEGTGIALTLVFGEPERDPVA